MVDGQTAMEASSRAHAVKDKSRRRLPTSLLLRRLLREIQLRFNALRQMPRQANDETKLPLRRLRGNRTMTYQIEILDPRSIEKRRWLPICKVGKMEVALTIKKAFRQHGIRTRVREPKENICKCA